jgi:hypothetical protein
MGKTTSMLNIVILNYYHGKPGKVKRWPHRVKRQDQINSTQKYAKVCKCSDRTETLYGLTL